MPDPVIPMPEDLIRHDWTAAEIERLLTMPLLDLVYRAQTVHRAHQDGAVQLASLLSIKTGGCPEDCAYCPQSAHYARGTGVAREALMPVETVLAAARRARDAGATRFCMGAAWREVRDGREFDDVLAMVRGVRALGMEACATLGMLAPHQARQLAEAGLTAYNHNLDTSPEFYGEIISTRDYGERLETLGHVRDAGITLCCGGIIGMGETVADRARLLEILATNPHPESVPINALVAVPGTPARRPPAESTRSTSSRTVRRRTHRDAGSPRPPLGGPRQPHPRSPSPLLHGRRQLDLLRRKTPHHRQQRRRRGSRDDRRAGAGGGGDGPRRRDRVMWPEWHLFRLFLSAF